MILLLKTKLALIDNLMLLIIPLHFVGLRFRVLFNYLRRMLSLQRKKHQHRRRLNQLNETSKDFVIGNKTNACAKRNGTLEPRTNSRSNNFERITVGESSACQNQVIENIFEDKTRKLVDNAFMTVENRRHDAI